MSKIVERAVSQQLHQYLADNDLLPRNQSAYRRHHSTEATMLRVLSDVLTAADAQQVTLFGLLDLSAAFDYVDHQLLLQRLRRYFGFTETVLAWTTSSVTGRTQQVLNKGCLQLFSPSSMVSHRDLSLAPYCLSCIRQKSATISRIVAQHWLEFHQYADDCHIYVHVSK